MCRSVCETRYLPRCCSARTASPSSGQRTTSAESGARTQAWVENPLRAGLFKGRFAEEAASPRGVATLVEDLMPRRCANVEDLVGSAPRRLEPGTDPTRSQDLPAAVPAPARQVSGPPWPAVARTLHPARPASGPGQCPAPNLRQPSSSMEIFEKCCPFIQ